MTTQITVAPAAPADQAAIANLLQLCLYERSDAGVDVSSQGRYPHPALDAYWSEPDHAAFLICAQQQLVGFALVNGASRLGSPLEGRAVAEFFILRRHRRQGIGRAAAAQIFDRFPGPWEVATPAAYVPAQSFWRGTVHRYTGGRYDEVWVQQPEWRGTVQRFTAS